MQGSAKAIDLMARSRRGQLDNDFEHCEKLGLVQGPSLSATALQLQSGPKGEDPDLEGPRTRPCFTRRMALRCSECGALRSSETRGQGSRIGTTNPTVIARSLKLMHTNEAPADAELAYVRALVSETRTRLASLEEQISRIEAQREQLEDEHSILVEFQQQNVPIISALRRLPAEVLSEIFLWTLPGPEVGYMSPATNMQASPWILCQISRRWRAIALSTASLWSAIHIRGDTIAYPLPDMVRTQTARARRLKIHFAGSEKGSATAQVELFEFLSEHSARWEELSIVLTAALVPRVAALRGRLPLLKKLWIQWARDDVESQGSVETIQCFETALALMDVGGHNNKPHTMLPLLPVHQLTSYRVHGSWNMHVRVLKMAPNIVEARITVLCDDDDPWPEPSKQAINMWRLQRLHVSDVKILEYLRAPALLEISFYLEEEDAPLDCLSAFFNYSPCSPRRLCLEGTPNARTTADILDKYPSITSFVLVVNAANVDPDVSIQVLNSHLAMLSLGNARVVSPHLVEICIGSMDYKLMRSVDYPFFLNMLRSRRQTPRSTLSAASFLTSWGMEPDATTLSGLDELREGGLHLLMRYGTHAADVQWRIKRFTYGAPWI